MTIAYFSMEYSLPEENIPFAGGLGILAGDYLLEAGSQHDHNFLAFGLFYQPSPVNPEDLGFEKAAFFPLTIADEQLFVTCWSKQFGSAKIYLLGTENSITRRPYWPDRNAMIKQQLLLGAGAFKVISELNLKIDVYHLNEGHSSFILIPLIEKYGRENLPKIVCTKHTILREAGLFLKREELISALIPTFPNYKLSPEEIFKIGTDDKHPTDFSTTKFMIVHSKKGNAVSASHDRFEKIAHPNSPLQTITNGINTDRWLSKDIETLGLPTAHFQNKTLLLNFINEQTGSTLDPNLLTVVWARRLASYKRPELLFTDLAKLAELTNMGVQFALAGPVNTEDPSSLALAAKFKGWAEDKMFSHKIAFLPFYNPEVSKMLVSGADVWLNTPIVGKEACGTSGMKAGLNGALMFSTNDGWVAEEDWSEMGWVLPEEDTANSLYRQIKDLIAPMFYQNKPEWEKRMEKTASLCRQKYSTTRMWQDYVAKLYS